MVSLFDKFGTLTEPELFPVTSHIPGETLETFKAVARDYETITPDCLPNYQGNPFDMVFLITKEGELQLGIDRTLSPSNIPFTPDEFVGQLMKEDQTVYQLDALGRLDPFMPDASPSEVSDFVSGQMVADHPEYKFIFNSNKVSSEVIAVDSTVPDSILYAYLSYLGNDFSNAAWVVSKEGIFESKIIGHRDLTTDGWAVSAGKVVDVGPKVAADGTKGPAEIRKVTNESGHYLPPETPKLTEDVFGNHGYDIGGKYKGMDFGRDIAGDDNPLFRVEPLVSDKPAIEPVDYGLVGALTGLSFGADVFGYDDKSDLTLEHQMPDHEPTFPDYNKSIGELVAAATSVGLFRSTKPVERVTGENGNYAAIGRETSHCKELS